MSDYSTCLMLEGDSLRLVRRVLGDLLERRHPSVNDPSEIWRLQDMVEAMDEVLATYPPEHGEAR